MAALLRKSNFVFDLPRLSVDIDLNYVGMQSREGMINERPLVEKALETDHSWKVAKLQECKQALGELLPFADHEKEFLKNLSEKGKIQATLLTNDPLMQVKIENLPLLRWRASLVQSST